MDKTEAAKTRLDLLDRALRYSTDSYNSSGSTYSALDSKAQATIGVSGVFVAGTAALVGSLPDPGGASNWGGTLIVVTYTLLVAAILASIMVLRVRKVAAPMDSASITEMTLDVVDLSDEELTMDVRFNWYRDQLHAWDGVIKEIEETNSKKASWLLRAQVMLLVAIVFAGFATVGF